MQLTDQKDTKAPTVPILTPADHQHFIEHGYVILRGILSEDTVAAARAVVEGWPEERQGAFAAADDPALVACVEGAVDAAVAELFGGVAHHRSEMQYKGRSVTPDAAWKFGGVHVDSNYPTMMPDTWAVGAFIFVTPVATRGGALCVKPGSPKRYRGLMLDGYANYHLEEGGNLDGLTEVIAEAGDAIVFGYNIGHASSENTAGPTARMAVDARYAALGPIVPGDRPFDELSTLEKAYSTRFQLPDRAMAQPLTVAASGIDEAVRAHALVRFGGRTWRFATTVAEPGVIVRESTTDFANWTARESVALPVEGDVEALSFFAHYAGVYLSVSRGSRGTTLHCTRDMQMWEQVAAMPDVERGSVFRTSEHSGNGGIVKEATMFTVDDRSIRWRCGPAWDALGAPAATGELAPLPSGTGASDAFVGPVVSDHCYALVVDLDVDGATSPHAALSRHLAAFEEPLRPLAYDGDGAPRQIRLYDRTLRWWMVGYLAEVDGVATPRLGSIDWSDEEPRLVEINTPEQLGAALATVGLR